MLLKCINNEDRLTIGKNYDLIEEDNGYYIVDYNNIENWYPKRYFKPLAEIIKERNDKIDKLLEDES